MSRIQRRLLILFGSWLALIFITSCFVIPFDTFVHFVQGLSGSAAFKQWFAWFWLVSWLFIVKGWHATEYAILVCLCTLTLQAAKGWSRQRSAWIAFVFGVLFAMSDEWHQTFVPVRDGCVRDVLIDSAGAAIALIFLLRRTRNRHAMGKIIDDET